MASPASSLMDLVSHQIAPFSPPTGNRVTITGPMVRLNAQAAQILGMAVHELSTNAVKYGAFSGDAGLLEVDWVLDGTDLNFGLARNRRRHCPWAAAAPALAPPCCNPWWRARWGPRSNASPMPTASNGASPFRAIAIDPAAVTRPVEPDADE